MLNEQNQSNDPNRNENSVTDEHIVSLVIRYLDENLTAAELTELNGLLRKSRHARELFVRHLTQEACLGELHYEETLESLCESNFDLKNESQKTLATPSLRYESHDPLTSEIGTVHSSTVLPNQNPLWNNWAIGLMSLVVVLAGVLTYRLGSESPSKDGAPSTILVNSQDSSLRSEPLGVGPLEVRTIHVQSGSGRFTLPRIGYLLTEGPTHLEMIGPLQARLNYGKIKVAVTEKSGLGFSVETPDGKVTDLGTEFLLDVSPGGKSSVSVLNGKVNLQVAKDEVPVDETPIELLNQGDGVIFCKGGEIERLMSIVTSVDTFSNQTSVESNRKPGTITEVSDNLGTSDTKKFYEIVRQGLREDALAYVDRSQHEWNGISRSEPIPAYLNGADYVKTYNQDKIHPDLEMKVTVSEPCDLYIFLDARLQLPSWVYRDYVHTGDLIGMDYITENEKKRQAKNGVGPGRSVNNQYTIWKRRIEKAGVVSLGSNFEKGAVNFQSKNIDDSTMYGIAAVPLKRNVDKVDEAKR